MWNNILSEIKYISTLLIYCLNFQVIPKDMDDLSAIQSRNAEEMEHLLTITPEVHI